MEGGCRRRLWSGWWSAAEPTTWALAIVREGLLGQRRGRLAPGVLEVALASGRHELHTAQALLGFRGRTARFSAAHDGAMVA